MRRIAALACVALPLVAQAQSPDSSADRSGNRAMEFWAGYSNRSPKWGILGNRPGMSFAMVAGRMTRRIKTRPGYAVDYTVDIIPLAISSPPLGMSHIGGDTPRIIRSPAESCRLSLFGDCPFPQGSAYGAGVSPIGFTAVYHRDKAFQPRIGATGGLLFFDRAVPTVISTRFNFTVALEGGFQLLNRNGDGLLMVYRFHHLSNAGTGYDNSALASHVISVGARFRNHLY